jgi:hypothetical protein
MQAVSLMDRYANLLMNSVVHDLVESEILRWPFARVMWSKRPAQNDKS